MAIYADITEMKIHEAELAAARDAANEASRTKSSFLANMSHELRTPLNAIIGVTEMLREDAADFKREDEFEPLDRVMRAGRHLLALINDILDLSKIEAGKMEVHVEEFGITALIDDVVKTIETLATQNDNQVVVECAPQIGTMQADQTGSGRRCSTSSAMPTSSPIAGRLRFERNAARNRGAIGSQFP